MIKMFKSCSLCPFIPGVPMMTSFPYII